MEPIRLQNALNLVVVYTITLFIYFTLDVFIKETILKGHNRRSLAQRDDFSIHFMSVLYV